MEGVIYALRMTILTSQASLAGIVRIIPQNSITIYRFAKIYFESKIKAPLLSTPFIIFNFSGIG
ncbi:hypothetical protein V8V55_27140, partial [Priestia megaterium]|uniref:hypothetical protein n=1 Tax=Priestia megaterium TaxID=1404 RepID=UPI00300AC93F